MKIPDCPKRLNHCPGEACPMFPCWAYDKHMDAADRNKKNNDRGWE